MSEKNIVYGKVKCSGTFRLGDCGAEEDKSSRPARPKNIVYGDIDAPGHVHIGDISQDEHQHRAKQANKRTRNYCTDNSADNVTAVSQDK